MAPAAAAAAASKFTINLTPPYKRGQIKVKVVKTIAKSLHSLAIRVAGKLKKGASNGGDVIPTETVGGLKSACRRKMKQRRPKRGDVKIMIFKLIVKSVKGFAIGVAGKEMEVAGNGGNGGGFSSTTTVIPVETVGGLKPDFEYEIKETKPLSGEIRINICEMIAGSIFQVSDSGGKKKVDGGAWAGIVPMGLESENDR